MSFFLIWYKYVFHKPIEHPSNSSRSSENLQIALSELVNVNSEEPGGEYTTHSLVTEIESTTHGTVTAEWLESTTQRNPGPLHYSKDYSKDQWLSKTFRTFIFGL